MGPRLALERPGRRPPFAPHLTAVARLYGQTNRGRKSIGRPRWTQGFGLGVVANARALDRRPKIQGSGAAAQRASSPSGWGPYPEARPSWYSGQAIL